MAANDSKQKPRKRKTDRRKSDRRGKPAKINLDELFVDGEEVVLEAKIHEAIYWQSFAVFGLSLLVAFLVAVELGALLAVVAVLMFMYAVAKKEILQLVLTNKRIFARYGILQVDVVDIQFSKIESIELERMLPGFVFGYSNVVIMGTGNRYIVIPYVANALAIRRAYNRISLEDAPSGGDGRGQRESDQVVRPSGDGRGRRESDQAQSPPGGRRETD